MTNTTNNPRDSAAIWSSSQAVASASRARDRAFASLRPTGVGCSATNRPLSLACSLRARSLPFLSSIVSKAECCANGSVRSFRRLSADRFSGAGTHRQSSISSSRKCASASPKGGFAENCATTTSGSRSGESLRRRPSSSAMDQFE